MKPLLCFLIPLLGSLAGLASAQTPIPQFAPQFIETFEGNPGATTQFPGFPPLGGGANTALFSTTTGGGLLFKNQDMQVLPPLRGRTCLYALGTDVRIDFLQGSMRRFGGFFSRTNISGGPATVTFQFFQGPVQVGNTVTVALPPTGGPGTSNYIGLFFDLFSLGGYTRVDIIGGGGVFPGLVGMDNLLATQ